MPCKHRIDTRFVALGHVRENHVLVGGQAELDAGKFSRDLAQRDFLRVFHTTHPDEQREKPFPIHGLVPAIEVAGRRKFARLRRLKHDAGAVVHFVAHEFHAALGHDVFESRPLAVGAVAEIAVNRQHGLRHLDEFVRREKADDIRQARISLLIAVAAAHASANGEVVANQPVVLDDGDEPKAVRENIQVVHRRYHEGDFEFARQISFAVERVNKVFVLRLFEFELHAVNPDGVIGGRPGRKRHRHPMGIRINLFARLRVGGRRWSEHVSVHVATRRERGEQRLVDLFDQRTQIIFHDPVELDALPRGDTQGIVAILRGEVVEHAPLLRRHHAAGDAAANHHDVFLAGLAQIAVVLLIRAVKFQELVVVLGKMAGLRIGERLSNRARERRAVLLQELVVRWRSGIGGRCHNSTK